MICVQYQNCVSRLNEVQVLTTRNQHTRCHYDDVVFNGWCVLSAHVPERRGEGTKSKSD